MTTQNKHKLDIFDVLNKLSKKNAAFYDALTTEEQKALHPLVVMRWLSGSSDKRQLFFLNELVNPLVFPLANHKKLLVQLMSICTSGESKRYQWNRAQPKRGSNTPACVAVVCDYLGYSSQQALDVLPILDDTDILEYAGSLGRQLDDLKLIKKELKTR